jgi:hypothetical protein
VQLQSLETDKRHQTATAVLGINKGAHQDMGSKFNREPVLETHKLHFAGFQHFIGTPLATVCGKQVE